MGGFGKSGWLRLNKFGSLKATIFLQKSMISMRILGHRSFDITSPAAPGWLPGALALQPPGGGFMKNRAWVIVRDWKLNLTKRFQQRTNWLRRKRLRFWGKRLAVGMLSCKGNIRQRQFQKIFFAQIFTPCYWWLQWNEFGPLSDLYLVSFRAAFWQHTCSPLLLVGQCHAFSKVVSSKLGEQNGKAVQLLMSCWKNGYS